MKIPKLKLRLWQELVYFTFVAIIPIIFTSLELFNSHSSVFKWTFASIGAILITAIVLRKFVFTNYIKKLQEKCVLLEHDYSIEVGKKENIEYQWGKFNAIIYCYSAFIIILSLVLCVLFITALTEQLIAFRGAAIIILSSVIVGLVWKIALYLRRCGKADETETE